MLRYSLSLSAAIGMFRVIHAVISSVLAGKSQPARRITTFADEGALYVANSSRG